jgi:hypothetical protein
MGDSILFSFDLLAVTITVCKLLSDICIDFIWLKAISGVESNKKRKNLK